MQYPSDFEQRIALAWAAAWLAKYDAAHPQASGEERKKEFLEALEGGFVVARDAADGFSP